MIPAKDIIMKLEFKLGEYAGDALAYDAEIRKANPWSQEYKQLIMKYNKSIDIKKFIEEFLDEIEECDTNKQ